MLQNIAEDTLWDTLIGADSVKALSDGFITVKDYRNDVMHAHNIDTQTYQEAKKLFEKINAQLDAEIGKIIETVEEQPEEAAKPEFNEALNHALQTQNMMNALRHLSDAVRLSVGNEHDMMQKIARQISESYASSIAHQQLLDSIKLNLNAQPVFLLMKQAISTGWDCPRAKILVKLREGMNESFEIQTIGRIRRMPEARHYEDDLLDFCYVYTFDEKYKAGLLSGVDKAYETRRLFLKDKCKTFTLEKEIRDLDFDGLGEREVLIKIHEALVSKYHLGSDKKQNRMLLSDAGYVFGAEIHGQALQGEFVRTSALADSHSYITTHKRIDTHKHGMQLMHSIDAIKTSIGMTQNKVKTILERLFRKGGNTARKLVALETAEFYAFVINNQHKLKEEFREVTAQMAIQLSLHLNPKKSVFRIPEQDFFRYDPNVKGEVEYLSNAYHDYTSGFATSIVRSTCEMLFEQYCESRDDIEWVYKNGDTGQQFFSIVYVDGIQKQWLFYADYIVMKKDGTVWVIETKGGEFRGQDKNIDRQIENKFNAFKAYAAEHKLHWGFVRDKDNQLYINNTEYVADMADERWVQLAREF